MKNRTLCSFVWCEPFNRCYKKVFGVGCKGALSRVCKRKAMLTRTPGVGSIRFLVSEKIEHEEATNRTFS